MELSILISLSGAVFSLLGIVATAFWHISIASRNYGQMDQRVKSLQNEVTEHKAYPAYRGHAPNGGPRPDP